MGQTTIMQRLAALVAVPLIALIVVSGAQAWQSFQTVRDAGQTQRLMHLAVSIGKLIHAMQIERGATAGFIQSKGQRFADILPAARARANESQQAYKRELNNLDLDALPALGKAIGSADGAMANLDAVRQKADQFAASAAETTAYYTATISQLSEAIGAGVAYNKNAAIAQQAIAYISFIRAKENAGQERALGTAVFTANRVEPPQLRAILDRVSRQDAHFAGFSAVAGAAEQASLKAALESAPAREVLRLRTLLVDKATEGGFDVDPTFWFKSISAKIDGLHETENLITTNIIAAANTLHDDSRSALILFIVLDLMAIALTIAFSLWVAHSVSRPLKDAVAFAENVIARNDFTGTMPEAGTVEVARTAQAFNHLIHKFRDIIAGTKQSSAQITAAATEMAASSGEVSQSSVVQAEETASVAAAVEQASTSVSETAASAQNASSVVAQAREDNDHALRVMQETIDQMNSIARIIEASSHNVERLDESSQRIGGIVQVIKEIADQTNLLALNAAIEAARAGEQGRGFAVVADEVRKLAERTTQATSEIGTLIGSIQTGIGNTVASMAEANAQAETNLGLVSRTQDALHKIDEGSRTVASNVETITYALSEQDTAIRQIAHSIEQIARMTENNTRATEGNNRIAGDLNELSSQLRAAVSQYTV
ncbi:methyl-accepting chemotaxis protein [Denitratisoma sp. agr-D3]